MKTRPALVAAVSLATGILFASQVPISFSGIYISILSILILSVVGIFTFRHHTGRERSSGLSFLIILVLAGMIIQSVSESHRNNAITTRLPIMTDSIQIYGFVEEKPVKVAKKMRCVLHVVSIVSDDDSLSNDLKIQLTILLGENDSMTVSKVRYGSFIRFIGKIEKASDERNPGEFSYRKYLSLHGISGITVIRHPQSIEVISNDHGNRFIEKVIHPIQRHIEYVIRSGMSGDNAAFVIGLLLGDKSSLSEEIRTAFANTGTIHVLAVSGTHVAVVAATLFTIFGLFRFHGPIKIAATMLGIVLYAFVVGNSPSVMRASLMALLILSGRLFQQKVDVYNSLGVAAVIILGVDPSQLFDVGFQLSFAAVFSIVYFHPKIMAVFSYLPDSLLKIRSIQGITQLFAVSCAAQVGTLPFTVWYFGKFSLIALIVNIFVVPVVGVVIVIGIAGSLIGVLWLTGGALFSGVNGLISEIVLSVVKFSEKIPFASITWNSVTWAGLLAYGSVLWGVFNYHQVHIVKRSVFLLCCAIIMSICAPLFEHRGDLQVAFLDVGQGDAAVVQFPSGKVMVVDAGPLSSSYDAGEKIVAPFLKRNGISTIDLLVTSHPHADHMGGVPYLMKNFSVVTVLDPDQNASSALFEEYQRFLPRSERIVAHAGSMIDRYENVRLYVLHPTHVFIDRDSSDGYHDLNESSVVLKLVYGTTSFLFTGDAEIPSERHLVHWYGDFLRSDIVKAGHHGSITSSSEDFIDAISPKEVVVSVGRFNKFKHPSSIVLDRFNARQIHVDRTDTEGAIMFRSDGYQVKRITWKGNE